MNDNDDCYTPKFRSYMLVQQVWEASQAANNMSKLLAGATGLQGSLSPAERNRHELMSVIQQSPITSGLVSLQGYEL